MKKLIILVCCILGLGTLTSIPVKAQGLVDNNYPAAELPHSLPYTVGGTTYEHVIVWPHSGTNDHWVAYYNGSLTWDNNFPQFYFLPMDNVCFYQSSPVGGGPSTSNATCSAVEMYMYRCSKTYFSDVDILAGGNGVLYATPFANPDCPDINYSTNDVIIEGRPVPQEFTFPFFPTYGLTPYTAPVSSVMDHSMSSKYSKNGIVLAFNGEQGLVGYGCRAYPGAVTCNAGNYTTYSVVGFENSTSGSFLEDGSGNKLLNYPGGPSGSNDTFLFYDGHPGYDYPKASGNDIYSPIFGTLCAATSTTTPSTVWRDATKCPLPAPITETWSGFHTFYILADDVYINGQMGDYAIVFLHSSALESAVAADITSNGYATVNRYQHIAYVGDEGASGYHMHFEVYKYNTSTTNWDLVDPYGDGTNNILWKQ